MSERQIVVCELGEARYGLDIARVREIIRLAPITSVPGTPAYLEGILNLRGRIIPVVELAGRFGQAAAARTASSRIVVAETQDTLVGLIVDGVSEVLLVPDDAVEETPALVGDADYVAGIARLDGHLVTLLDLERLFADEAVEGAA